MTVQDKAVILRRKKLGVLLCDARLAARRSPEECAAAMGVSLADYLAFEDGTASPTLPQIELLSYLLRVPLEHFWENKAISENNSASKALDPSTILPSRQKMIGSIIRQSREQAHISVSEMADKLNMDPAEVLAAENGEKELDLVTLEKIAAELNRRIDDFIDPSGPAGSWQAELKTIEKIKELSPELQEFLLKQVNQPYLDLARHLSELSTEKLRAIAEGILEITL